MITIFFGKKDTIEDYVHGNDLDNR